ncbi:MAG: DUF2461 domain-containing protein [Bacteroidia bacterium]|nr:DUF2461 domain-containing protein [Bacteroidia bacterium]
MAKKINPFDEHVQPPFAGFPKDMLRFFKELKANNTREWFLENKKRYEESVREPMLSLLDDLANRLRAVDSDIEIDPRKALYRINRDVRFSADKSPYKTNTAAAFTLRGYDRKVDAAYYFHIMPGEVGVGGGLYAPSGDQLKKLRPAIAANPDEFRAILADKKFARLFGGLTGESLTRVPQGFDKDHPAADLLMRKQFLAWAELPGKSLDDGGFADILVEHFTAMTPFIRYLLKNG